MGAVMIPDPLAWFSIGALFGLVICGWPWHHRFSRYSRSSRYRAGEDGNGNCVPPPHIDFYGPRSSIRGSNQPTPPQGPQP